MVESNQGAEDAGLNFDSLMQDVDYNAIRDKQHSCYAKDLKMEETPDFLQ